MNNLNPEHRYYISKPSPKRPRFDLLTYVLADRKNKSYVKPTESIKAIVKDVNQRHRSGELSTSECTVLLEQFISRLYASANLPLQVFKQSRISLINQKVFSAFWRDVYEIRQLEDPNSARYDFQKALRLIEPLALQTATAHELQGQLKSRNEKVQVIRRAVARLNEILKYLKRDIQLHKPKGRPQTPDHLTEPEFQQLITHVSDPVIRDLATVLFCSGLRFAEALALEPTDLKGQNIHVTKQLDKQGVLKFPKRGKSGVAVLFGWGVPAAERWVAVTNKGHYRNRFPDEIYRACIKAFPSIKTKWISPHDLRHSHAIALLGKGATLTQVALNLRNGIGVCQQYYTGFAHSCDSADALTRLLAQ